MCIIYEMTPDIYGDNFRVVDSFDNRENALKVLNVLESVNNDFKIYRLYQRKKNIIYIYHSDKKEWIKVQK